jgi:hypothetical protein
LLIVCPEMGCHLEIEYTGIVRHSGYDTRSNRKKTLTLFVSGVYRTMEGVESSNP